MDKVRILHLLRKQNESELSDLERDELDAWYDSLSFDHILEKQRLAEDLKLEMLTQFRESINKPFPPVSVSELSRGIRKVAAVLAWWLFGSAIYLMTASKPIVRDSDTFFSGISKIKDVAPGTNRAILTLGDGSRIDLNESHAGLIAQQGNVEVLKLADGTIDYSSSGSRKSSSVVMFNSILTPRGGEYKLTLPDGSKVWLNASSSLRYPTQFTGSERKVEVSGEVYFEVAKNVKMPFVVSVNGGEEVKVLGTQFNINAYKEEGPERITLIEGSVEVAEGKHSITLKPGQQTFYSEAGFKVEVADLEQVTAWKTGFFEFENSSLETILREISRWYDVDISYQGRPKTTLFFGGRISRNLPISKVLTMLNAYGLQSEINGREIIIKE